MEKKGKRTTAVFITFFCFAVVFNIHIVSRFIRMGKDVISGTSPVSIERLRPSPPRLSGVLDIDGDGEGEVVHSCRYSIPGKQEISIFEPLQKDFNLDFYGEILVPSDYVFFDGYYNEKQQNYFFCFLELKDGRLLKIEVDNRQDTQGKMLFESLPMDLSPYESGFIKPSTVDLDGDGIMELVVIMGNFEKQCPSITACYNLQTGKKRWFYPSGTGIVGAQFQDMNGNGKKEILLSTFAANKEVEMNRTSDAHSYALVLDSEGKLLWQQQTGDWITYSWNVAADLDNDGICEVVSACEFHRSRMKQWNKVVILNGTTGEEQKMFPRNALSFSRPFVSSSDPANPRIYVGDSDGWIWMFDKDLKVLNKIKAAEGPISVQSTSPSSSFPAKKWQYVFAATQNQLLVFNPELTGKMFSFNFAPLKGDQVVDPAEPLLIPIPTAAGFYGLLNADKLYLVHEKNMSFAGRFHLFVSSGLLLILFAFVLFNGFFIYFIYLYKTTLPVSSVGEVNGENGDTPFIEIIQGILHQIKNPISTVLWTAEKIKRNAVAGAGERNNKSNREMYAQMADFLLDDVKTLKQQTNNLLRMIQVSKPRFREQNLRPLLQRIVRHFRALSDSKIEIRLDMEEDIYLAVDDELFKEAVINLLDNAVDAMPGGGKLIVSAVPVMSPITGSVEEVLIEVEDTGHGISEADLSEIFTPFFTSKRNDKGTGIGLTICKRIVEAHKGKIEVHSRVELGTKIAITLPVKTKLGGGP